MAKIEVTRYQVTWQPQHDRGIIEVEYVGGQRPVPVNSSGEFVAVLLMLARGPVLIDTVTGNIECPLRPVGS